MSKLAYKANAAYSELKQTAHTATQELEIVYRVHPEERRKGVKAEVLTFFRKQQTKWQRTIIATVSPRNLHSVHLCLKSGSNKEETLHDTETGEKYLKLTLDINSPFYTTNYSLFIPHYSLITLSS